jgi:hypothetical protein
VTDLCETGLRGDVVNWHRYGFGVSRGDAAHVMLRVLRQHETVGHAIAIPY